MGRHQGLTKSIQRSVITWIPVAVVVIATACIPSWKTMTPTVPSWEPTCNVRLLRWIDPKALLVLVWNTKQPMTQERQLLHNMVVCLPIRGCGQSRSSPWRWFPWCLLHPKFRRSNSGTAYNQRTLVRVTMLSKRWLIADGPSMERWNVALTNPIVAYMTWEGYKLEDAVIMSERFQKDDVSYICSIEEYEPGTATKLGPGRNYSWNSKRWWRCP